MLVNGRSPHRRAACMQHSSSRSSPADPPGEAVEEAAAGVGQVCNAHPHQVDARAAAVLRSWGQMGFRWQVQTGAMGRMHMSACAGR